MFNKRIIWITGIVLLVIVIISFFFIFTNISSINFVDTRSNINLFEIVVDSMNFPEGPAWDGKGSVYVSSCYGGWITKIINDKHSVFLSSTRDSNTIKQTNGLTVNKDGSLFACDYGKGAILRINPDKKVEEYAKGFNDKPFNRPNDLAFDPDGNLYFSDPKSYNKEILDGAIYRIEANTRKVTLAAKDLAFPNGLAFSADAKFLFVCESAKHRILKFRVNPDGILSDSSIFVELPGGDPDGINFDKNGNLYVAHFGGGAIYVLAPDGTIKRKIPTPGKKPSNVEFAGEDLKMLYITEDETNSVYRMRVEVPGLPLFSHP
jgi:gluconolactonase